jgi:hypothetical protein
MTVNFADTLDQPRVKAENDGSWSVYVLKASGASETLINFQAAGTAARPPLTQELAARGWQRDEAGKLVVT